MVCERLWKRRKRERKGIGAGKRERDKARGVRWEGLGGYVGGRSQDPGELGTGCRDEVR